jgi:hypothetical protein
MIGDFVETCRAGTGKLFFAHPALSLNFKLTPSRFPYSGAGAGLPVGGMAAAKIKKTDLEAGL